MTDKERLKRILDLTPESLVSDWEGTNHYELQDPNVTTSSKDGYWWLDLDEVSWAYIVLHTDGPSYTDEDRLGAHEVLDKYSCMMDALYLLVKQHKGVKNEETKKE
jgi:hypothetical protein